MNENLTSQTTSVSVAVCLVQSVHRDIDSLSYLLKARRAPLQIIQSAQYIISLPSFQVIGE
jgi:hypothetical protein